MTAQLLSLRISTPNPPFTLRSVMREDWRHFCFAWWALPVGGTNRRLSNERRQRLAASWLAFVPVSITAAAAPHPSTISCSSVQLCPHTSHEQLCQPQRSESSSIGHLLWTPRFHEAQPPSPLVTPVIGVTAASCSCSVLLPQASLFAFPVHRLTYLNNSPLSNDLLK